MFSDSKITVSYSVAGEEYSASGNCKHFDLTFSFDGESLKLTVLPKEKITLHNALIKTNYKYPQGIRVMPNGYQSWTKTREYEKGETFETYIKLADYIPLAKKCATASSDTFYRKYPKCANLFTGYTFAYLHNKDEYTLLGSLSERVGYTVFTFDLNNDTVTVEKDLEGKVIDSETVLADVVILCGKHDDIFDKYFEKMNIAPCKSPRICGYTSWYNYYTNISEEIAIRDLNALAETGADVNVFQIDDGYQSFVGDWEICNEKFPHGMKYIADSVHEKGWKAGLWLAPFYAQKKSLVVKNHPDWIVKDENGKPLFGFLGTRPTLTLDFYNPECAAYIKHFFDTILNEWGFDLVKLDFLYTACILPRNGKSRGEIMCDAMDFLRECVGDKLILGCGVPLGPAFGKVDYCRIGSDVDLTFEPRFGKINVSREIISMQTAMQNTLFRRGLNGRAFGNDPDVFYLRNLYNEGKGGNKPLRFTEDQKLLWAEICRDFGSIIFTSDNAGNYDQKQRQALIDTYTAPTKKILDVRYYGGSALGILYEEDGKTYDWTINWLNGKNTIKEL